MDKKDSKNLNVSINPDTTPILYTDSINMTANNNGVVLNVIQSLGATNQARIVARVGMSREHAKNLVQELGKLLLMTEGKVETGRKN